MNSKVSPPNYPWLTSIRRGWIIRYDRAPTWLVFVSIGALLLARSGPQFLLAIMLLAFSLSLAQFLNYCFYNKINCPRCGANPSRFKNGNKRPYDSTWKLYLVAKECPRCGNAANESEESTIKAEA
jgi:endogenous inhibitor of DNA gyrase (YacG/DUF329 family)